MADKNIRPEVGRRIKELRKKKHYSLSKLSSLLEMDASRISGYENGRRALDIETLSRFAEILETTLDYLWYGTGNRYAKYRKPKKKENVLLSLADLVDNRIIFQTTSKTFLNLNENYRRFLKEYIDCSNSFDHQKVSKKKRIIQEYLLLLKDESEAIGLRADDVTTALQNMQINLLEIEFADKKEK